jgi:hypothetical protein
MTPRMQHAHGAQMGSPSWFLTTSMRPSSCLLHGQYRTTNTITHPTVKRHPKLRRCVSPHGTFVTLAWSAGNMTLGR